MYYVDFSFVKIAKSNSLQLTNALLLAFSSLGKHPTFVKKQNNEENLRT